MVSDLETPGTPAPQRLRFSFSAVDTVALTWGQPEDPVALLIHGFPDSAWTWSEVAPAIAEQGWYVVAPFTRGYAPSSLAYDDDYSIGSLVDDVVNIYRAVGADCRATIIGHDWGGAIASAVAATHPQLFARAVLIAIPPLAAIRDLANPRKLLKRLWVLARQAPRSWYMPVVSVPALSDAAGERLIATLWDRWTSTELAPYREQGMNALGSRARRRAAFSYYRAVWNPYYRRTPSHRAVQRSSFNPPGIPTLYLQGAADTCGLVHTGAHAMDHMPAGSQRVVIAAAGHFAHLESPQIVTQHILDFLKETSHEAS
ncbi:alpha/beta fold hydrolase [Mycolicibacterium conceptionense]|uniref:alpha/beta fold hydrolase n=2 Tax=Mycobacteriaceae TaxID=1762 RepID=UPI0009C013E3|nr:alpha/beta hydrolase [Mycolicibacterium conceptionense]